MTAALYFFFLFAALAFAFGCCVASFMNVCIWRIPREESVVRPGSHCPHCNAPIKWYQNIPVISWCLLRGRCAHCHKPISARYIVVELLGGVLFLAAYLQWAMPSELFRLGMPVLGMTPLASFWVVPVFWLAVAGLILGSFVDLAEQWLPDRVTIGGMILGVPLSFLVPEIQGVASGVGWAANLKALYLSLGTMVGGFLFMWILGLVFSKVLKKDALGFGDVKLVGAIGAFFGPWAVIFTFVISSVVGSLAGFFLIMRGRAKLGGCTEIAYGPFLALGVLVWMYWGPMILQAYLRLVMRQS